MTERHHHHGHNHNHNHNPLLTHCHVDTCHHDPLLLHCHINASTCIDYHYHHYHHHSNASTCIFQHLLPFSTPPHPFWPTPPLLACKHKMGVVYTHDSSHCNTRMNRAQDTTHLKPQVCFFSSFYFTNVHLYYNYHTTTDPNDPNDGPNEGY